MLQPSVPLTVSKSSLNCRGRCKQADHIASFARKIAIPVRLAIWNQLTNLPTHARLGARLKRGILLHALTARIAVNAANAD